MPDLRLSADDPSDQPPPSVAEAWLRQAEAFLEVHYEADEAVREARPKGPTKVQRLAGMHWLLAVGRTLSFFTSAGLVRYMVPDACGKLSIKELAQEPDVLAGTLPTLVCCSDQGGGGFQAWHYLLYACRLRGMLMSDPSHRAWNDVKQAVVDTGLWPPASAMQVGNYEPEPNVPVVVPTALIV